MTIIRRVEEPGAAVPPETEAKRRQRVAREGELIAKARARLDAGEGVSGDELEAWLDAYATADGPVPVPGRQGAAAIGR
jgi:hypothetical protein